VAHAWGTERGAALVASRLKYPYLVTVQGLCTWCKEVGPVNTHEQLAAWIERRCLPRAPMVTTESRFSANFVREHFAPARVEQIEHAPDRVFRWAERRPKLSPRRFLFIGSFTPRKGADVLMRALDRVKDALDFELLVVGGCGKPFFTALRKELSDELWRRVVFKHNLSSAEVAGEMAQAVLMIYPTLVDVSPNVVKEAVVAGLPVVASAVGGIPDYVVPNRNGLLFAAGDLEACVRSIRKACEHPLFGRGLVDSRTLEEKRSYLSPETMARRFGEVYRLVGSGARANSVAAEGP
jgi:glycosyltransferase involved in cell wall biosynthesis